MKQKWKVTAGILTAVVCVFLGCEKKNARGESLLIVPVDENMQGSGDERPDAERADAACASAEDNALADLDHAAGQSLQKEKKLVIHICGEVNRPGVYILDDGSRIYQAIEAAGGFTDEAEEDYLNQADLLTDGRKIYVPTAAEVEDQKLLEGALENGLTGQVDANNSGLVNINTASLELLCTLPGVGEGKAQSIITYREENGSFRTIEDVMKVDGIKDGLFQKIRDKISV